MELGKKTGCNLKNIGEKIVKKSIKIIFGVKNIEIYRLTI